MIGVDGRDVRGSWSRRGLMAAAGGAAAWLRPAALRAAEIPDAAAVRGAVERGHDEAVRRLQSWIALPSIAAENRNAEAGARMMADLLKDAGFQRAEIVPTDGRPGVFATLDAGAPKTVGLYFMYDVKQFDPSEWSSPPLEGRLVERPGVGRVMIGRGATNQKGPEATFLATLHALRAAGRRPPVNLVLVAEGEEEIGSPHFRQVVYRPEVEAALRGCQGVFMPMARQSLDGGVELDLGAKGLIEVELVCSTRAWGRGALGDIHSSFKAELDSPVWRLVRALSTLVSEDGNDPAIDGWFEHVKPLTPRQKEMIAETVAHTREADAKKALGVQTWVRDLSYREALERLASQPTVNIEGLVAGYTGPGGKTILPSRAAAKLDLRIVPDQTAEEAARKLRAHLARRGYGDIEVKVTGGYNPTQTPEDSPLVRAMLRTYAAEGVEARLSPRLAGSYPGFVFTEPPLSLPAGHFGLGAGGGAHAPDEWYLIESANPRVAGMDGAALAYARLLYGLAEA